jgi:hypothetical protein
MGNTWTRLGLLMGYILASISLGMCFVTIKNGCLHIRGGSKQTDLMQSTHDSLQKDIDALQNKLDCLTMTWHCNLIHYLSVSFDSYLTHSKLMGVHYFLVPPIKKYFEH